MIFQFLSAGNVQKYDEKSFDELFNAVSKYYSKEELRKIIEKSLESDEITEKSLAFIYSPLTLKKQAESHENRLAKMINDETIKKGVDFFEKYKPLFCKIYDETKVEPSDVISIINWESKLGTITGGQKIIKVFAAQYFSGEKINNSLFVLVQYSKEEAMTVEAGKKRVERLKKNAFSNLKALLIQAKEKNFDPLEVKGSWAGAIGFPQFMPASMQYAKDGNGDGKIDLFVMEDAIASVANYLKLHGYLTKGSVASFKAYNNDKVYAEGVKKYSDSIKEAGAKSGSCGKADSGKAPDAAN
ncbi:lytic murein transglycosylase [bacterium]|jgi:membrane-bound lytic murein transglycosylase B|nr:lytic murein transglycosylase [bacterium]MBP5591287.1 lytic murein transglycosylase [bacterium]